MKNGIFLVSSLMFIYMSGWALADPKDGPDRQQIINHQMDCVSQRLDGHSIGWDDVCSTADSYYYMPVVAVAPPPPARRAHTLEGGQETYYNYFAEPKSPMKNTGEMYGYFANYTYRPPEGIVLNNPIINTYMVQGHYDSGELNYKGSGRIKRRGNEAYEIRAMVGRDFGMGRFTLTPYAGYGYRNLLDRGNDRITSDGFFYAFDRHSTFWYVPVGVNVTMPLGTWTAEANFEYDMLTKGLQVNDFSIGKEYNGGFENPNIHNNQEGFGARTSIKFTYVTPHVNFYVEPFVRFWDIQKSKSVSAVIDGFLSDNYEPRNTTIEAGSKLGLQF